MDLVKDSGQKALEWEAEHRERAMELNDLLDACPTLEQERELFKTFTFAELNGLMPERRRRQHNRMAPIGSLVRPRQDLPTAADKVPRMRLFVRTENSTMSCVYEGLATVLGQPEYGSAYRWVLLHTPWTDRAGTRIWCAEVTVYDLEPITELTVV